MILNSLLKKVDTPNFFLFNFYYKLFNYINKITSGLVGEGGLVVNLTG